MTRPDRVEGTDGPGSRDVQPKSADASPSRTAISGSFTKAPRGRQRCAIHPGAFEGQCGFYPGFGHGEVPGTLATQKFFDENMEIRTERILKSELKIQPQSPSGQESRAVPRTGV